MSSAHSPTFSSQLILQPFRRFTYVTAHSRTLPLVHLCHISFSNPSFASQSSFSNLSVTSPTSQLILQPFRRFTYVTTHSKTLPLLHLRHSSFSNPSLASQSSFSNLFVTSHTSQLILKPFRCFTYVTDHCPTLLSLLSAHSPTFPSLHLRHYSFSNTSVALPTSQLILQRFRCFTYVTVHSPTLLSLLRTHSPTFLSLHLRHN